MIAVLTAGPVGFGDSLPRAGFKGTNVTRLLLASRMDGVILKPAHPALRLDLSPPRGDTHGEIWVAPNVPARAMHASSGRGILQGTDAVYLHSDGIDGRVNSLARLLAQDGNMEMPSQRWWYSVLCTDVVPARKISPADLFPVPPSDAVFVAHTFQGPTCEDGALASSCLSLFSKTSPLEVITDTPMTGNASDGLDQPPKAKGTAVRNWKLINVAPVLPGGWLLLGEYNKYVSMSPQRFSAFSPATVTAHPVDSARTWDSDLHQAPPTSQSMALASDGMVPTELAANGTGFF